MRRLALISLAVFGLAAYSAEEQPPPPPPAPTEVPLSAAEQTLVDERIAAIRDADDFDAVREAYQMDTRYTERMRAAVLPAYEERFRQAVDAANTRDELELLRKHSPNLNARMHFNRRWTALANPDQATKN